MLKPGRLRNSKLRVEIEKAYIISPPSLSYTYTHTHTHTFSKESFPIQILRLSFMHVIMCVQGLPSL